MKQTTISPDSVYAELIKNYGKNKRSLRNLEIIHKICLEVSRSDCDFSPANIGRRSQNEGGPALNTLYSPLGKKFRDLMGAWEIAHTKGIKKFTPNAASKNPDIDTILAEVSNDTTRQQLRLLLAEHRKLKSDLKIAQQFGGGVTTIDYRSQQVQGSIQVIEPVKTLTDTERTALQHLLDNDWLRRNNLAEGPRGELISKETGRAVLEMGTLSGLRKLLGK